MANRCAYCNKFVAIEVEVEDPECEEGDPESGTVTLRATVNKNCTECGTTIKTGTVEVEATVNPKDWENALKEIEWEDC